MGKFSSLFRRSDKKAALAEQESADKHSPPPQYEKNPYEAAPPEYGTDSPQPPSYKTDSPQPPSYKTDSPQPPSYTSNSPALSAEGPATAGYPREKLGASGGGYGNLGDSPYGESTPSHGRRVQGENIPGGYEQGEDSRQQLFSSRLNTGLGLTEAGAHYAGEGAYMAKREMTEEELVEAEVEEKKAEIIRTQIATQDTAHRALAKAREAEERLGFIRQKVDEQESRLDHTRRIMHVDMKRQLHQTSMNNKKLAAYNRSILFPAWTASKKQEASDEWVEEQLERQRVDEALRQEERRRQAGRGPTQDVLGLAPKGNPANINRFIFEDNDEEQTKREHDIDETIGHLETSVRNIHLQATALSEVFDESNKKLADIGEAVDENRDRVVREHARMNRAARMDPY